MSSVSESVQSAWDDLVVENPNRAKLEGCLLSTIMLVVCCIIALLIYVFVQLQPQGKYAKLGRARCLRSADFQEKPVVVEA
ncbi:hypothetical protein MRX96_002923 [Rhipicephalus microplus]